MLVVVGLLSSVGWAQVERLQSREVVDRLYATVVQVRVPEFGGRGSGSIVSPGGFILTNDHVMRDPRSGRLAERADIYMLAGEWDEIEHRFVAEFVRSDPALDLAVLRIVADRDGHAVSERFVHLAIGDFRAIGLKLADELTTWGYPAFGGSGMSVQGGVVGGFLGEIDPVLFERLEERAAAAGVSVSVMRERLFALVPNGDRWIRTDASFTGGVSGGAAIDRYGVLVGVPTSVIIDSPVRLVRPAIYARGLLHDVPGVVYVERAVVPPVLDLADVLRPGQEEEFVRRALAGGTVRLAAGTFWLPNSLVLTRGVEIIGAGQTATIIQGGAAGGSSVLAFRGAGSFALRDLTIEYSGSSGADVVFVGGGAIDFRGITVQGARLGDSGVGTGIVLRGSVRGTVRDALVRDNGMWGVYVSGDAAVDLVANTIRNNMVSGISYGGSASGVARGNAIEANKGAGIAVYGHAGVTLENNTIRSNEGSGIAYGETASGVVRGNTSDTNLQAGILCYGDAQAHLTGNTLRNNAQYGIAMHTSAACTESSNRMTGNAPGNQVFRWTP